MSKHVVIVLLINLFLINACEANKKCCPSSENLIKITENNTQIYQCTNITENNVPLRSNKFKNFGFPQNWINETCIDKLIDPPKSNGEIILLKSDKKRLNSKPNITTINKCCPDGLFYNHKLKFCENEPTSKIDRIQDDLEQILNINYSFPICLRRVFMEKYFENISLKIQNGDLEISSLNIAANGSVESFAKNTYCLDTREKNNILSAIVVYCIPGELNIKDVCTNNTCVPKCCPFGHEYRKSKTRTPPFECYPTTWETPFTPGFAKNATPEDYYLMTGPICTAGRYRPTTYVVLKNGTIHSSKNLFYNSFGNKYCIERFHTDNTSKYHGVYCFTPNKATNFSKIFIHLIGILISILFLGVTLTIYFFLPELQNLHGRTVMSHTASLLAAYICIAFVKQGQTKFGASICLILGYGIMFTFLSAFTWLNVMCFDIWWTFGVVQARGLTKNKDLKRFICYCIYAHGVPLIITAIAITVDLHPDVPAYYKPKIAHYACWFNLTNNVPFEYTIFFITPVGILIICNMTLFVLTARHCLKIRSDIHRMQSHDLIKKKRFLADRATFLMNIKLFIVMGITWIFEIISVYVKHPEGLWTFFDTINALQGLWIFFIFVFKNNVWKAIKKKLGYETVREGSTQATVSTKMSIASNTSIKLNTLKQEEKDLLQNVVNAKNDE